MSSRGTIPSNSRKFDVLVIGGGPAGSTVSSLLAEKGWSVALLEKDTHPRFHIGESLLPMNLPILDRLGVLDQVRDIGIIKYGAEFNSDYHPKKTCTYYFKNAMNKDHPHAFEVRRSEFDHLLIKNSRTKGVHVEENTRVTDIDFKPKDSCIAYAIGPEGDKQEWKARFVIDASGRSTLLSRKLGFKTRHPKHNSAAIFAHFDHVVRRQGDDEGNISIYWFEHGWFWMIPLKDGVMSVGAVCLPEYFSGKHSNTDAFLWETIKSCPEVFDRMQNATMDGKARCTGNFSYLSSKMHGDKFILIGDAFAFVDPVFSSGVYIAMSSACIASDAVDTYLRNPKEGRRLLKKHEKTVGNGLKIITWFIYRFTSPALHKLFMQPSNRFRMEEAVISMLGGDIFDHSPVKKPVRLFKFFYYMTFLLNFRQSWWKRKVRKQSIGKAFREETEHED